MKTQETIHSTSWQPKVASLVIPVLIIFAVVFFAFSALSVHQIVGSGILLSVIILSLVVGDVKELPDKDIAILWVATVLYNLYLLSSVF